MPRQTLRGRHGGGGVDVDLLNEAIFHHAIDGHLRRILDNLGGPAVALDAGLDQGAGQRGLTRPLFAGDQHQALEARFQQHRGDRVRHSQVTERVGQRQGAQDVMHPLDRRDALSTGMSGLTIPPWPMLS